SAMILPGRALQSLATLIPPAGLQILDFLLYFYPGGLYDHIHQLSRLKTVESIWSHFKYKKRYMQSASFFLGYPKQGIPTCPSLNTPPNYTLAQLRAES